jgi:hypothetical protein
MAYLQGGMGQCVITHDGQLILGIVRSLRMSTSAEVSGMILGSAEVGVSLTEWRIGGTTTAEQMALAVLAGDRVAAKALADMIANGEA